MSGTGEIEVDENALFLPDPQSTKDKPLPDVAVQGGKCCVWAKAGKYTVTLTSIDFNTKKVQRTRFNFTVTSVQPPPTPNDTTVPNVTGKGYADGRQALIAAGFKVAPSDSKASSTIQSQSPAANTKSASGSIVTLTVTDQPPQPPQPDAPIKEPGFRVLIVEETADRSKLPVTQAVIMTSATFRNYLRNACVADSTASDGKAWRIWDKDTDATNELKLWQDALKSAKSVKDFKTPWIVVSNGKTGYSGPLPDTLQATMDLCKKYETTARKGK